MAETGSGTIILLNGTASSGKTRLAKAIQQVFDDPYLHIGIDLFWSIFPWGWHGAAGASWQHVPIPGTDPPKIATPMPPYTQLLHAGIYHTAAALARIGHNVVIDHVLYDAVEVPVMVKCWRELPVWMIGLHCPLAVLHARASARPDRLHGLAGVRRGHHVAVR
jgi:chloramphenicol 3-O phosphotransferase